MLLRGSTHFFSLPFPLAFLWQMNRHVQSAVLILIHPDVQTSSAQTPYGQGMDSESPCWCDVCVKMSGVCALLLQQIGNSRYLLQDASKLHKGFFLSFLIKKMLSLSSLCMQMFLFYCVCGPLKSSKNSHPQTRANIPLTGNSM